MAASDTTFDLKPLCLINQASTQANKIIEAQAEALELAEPILEAHAAALASEGSKIILA